MLLLEKLLSAPKILMRSISLFNVASNSLLCLLFGNSSIYIIGVLVLSVSTAILLMISDMYNDSGSSLFCAFSALCASLVTTLMDCCLAGASPIVLSVIYGLCALVPLMACISTRTYLIYNDIRYLTVKLSGWEMMLCLLKVCFMVASVTAFFVFILIAGNVSGNARWLQILVLILAFLIYALIYVRTMTCSPIVTFTRAGNPIGEKDVGTCAALQARTKEDYEVMYAKLCRDLEEKQHFLNPFYSLDDLSREMFTNKTYLSRMINECAGMNFNQLINQYRVDYSRELFMANTELKVKDLADMSGFNSQVTYNMAFKLFYDTTPGMWCKEYRDKVNALKNPSSPEASEQ